MSILIATIGAGLAGGFIIPPDGLRYGSYRDWQLKRRDARRCRRFRGRVRAAFRLVVAMLKGKPAAPAK